MIIMSSLCEKQMDQKKTAIEEKWIDPDDAPELTDAWFAQAEVRRDGKVIRRGRPRLDNPKKQVALRIDPDVIDRFKAEGAGWQSRMNEALRKAVGL
jgi:uncharacterized protein (DUF4415 family)